MYVKALTEPVTLLPRLDSSHAAPSLRGAPQRNGFGATHTVWGTMADAESMDLALKLVQGQSSSPRGQMRILDAPIRFTMTALDDAGGLVKQKA